MSEPRGGIYDDPDEVIVLAYIWTNGNASGGRREAFLRLDGASRRLSQLLDEGAVKDPTSVKVLRLRDATWDPMTVHLPQGLRIEPVGDGE